MQLKAFQKITAFKSLKPVKIGTFYPVDGSKAIMTGSHNVFHSIMADYDARIHAILYELAALQADALLQPYDGSVEANSIKFDVDAFSSQEYIQAMVNAIRGGINRPPRTLVLEKNSYGHSNRHKSHHRHRRSWLPFIGKIANTVFGTATDEDIANINLHIAKFEKLRTEITTGQTEILDKVHSLYKTVDKRVELLKSITDNIIHNITDLSHDIERNVYILVGLGFLNMRHYFLSNSFVNRTSRAKSSFSRLFA
jgi:hypothetical protein